MLNICKRMFWQVLKRLGFILFVHSITQLKHLDLEWHLKIEPGHQMVGCHFRFSIKKTRFQMASENCTTWRPDTLWPFENRTFQVFDPHCSIVRETEANLDNLARATSSWLATIPIFRLLSIPLFAFTCNENKMGTLKMTSLEFEDLIPSVEGTNSQLSVASLPHFLYISTTVLYVHLTCDIFSLIIAR